MIHNFARCRNTLQMTFGFAVPSRIARQRSLVRALIKKKFEKKTKKKMWDCIDVMTMQHRGSPSRQMSSDQNSSWLLVRAFPCCVYALWQYTHSLHDPEVDGTEIPSLRLDFRRGVSVGQAPMSCDNNRSDIHSADGKGYSHIRLCTDRYRHSPRTSP